MLQSKNRTESSLWQCLKSKQEISLNQKQQKVPDYRKIMLYYIGGTVKLLFSKEV